mmetsp:Transcript_1786/g.4019  ORF Transcript_1786/g.4019 Transcript_1786/m.4019 type:complete len:331 (+) Transcript_1786:138-1130(+)|eukprot:CAMPEP_0206446916 /NCGR_PEP_ID=MMETSP0324_2-20121206/16448_1 /ASSEMBLY_ACC=CAM_ASM_000836 /TAXON_ID=2866 /ORGANISM="Crypthecodinium cohnii, Strain Seligo" /LENGTH=330 /DNA_ID=CAMNT_0053915533 /DNA_START=133 /DNA_END=1125 /DNA_ORIENTATION=-
MGVCWSTLASAFSNEHRPEKYGPATSSPPPQLFGDGAGSESFYRSSDGRLWLHMRAWEPQDKSKTWATLLICHGTVDHSGVYHELAEKLCEKGIAVFAADLRGWGRSDGQPLHVASLDVLAEDVVHDYWRLHGTGAPYAHVRSRFLLGKSIGGLITAWAACKHPDLWTGLIGLSGAYDISPAMRPRPVAVLLLKAIWSFLPKCRVRRPFDPKLIVSDSEALRRWEQDPLVSRGKLSAGYLVQLLRGVDALPAMVPRLTCALLMLWGTGDKVVSESGHEMMIQDSKSTSKVFNRYPDGRHNLLAEPKLKEQVMQDILNFITSHAHAHASSA